MNEEALTNVSRETRDLLRRFTNRLNRWNRAINLVGPATEAEIWRRHIADSAQLMDLQPTGAKHWVDLGSGGGFPGLVVAILARERAPEMRVTLIESDQRKAAFLRTSAIDLGLQVNVLPQRIERAEPQRADIVAARALAPLPRLLGFAELHLKNGGTGLFLKGAGYATEVDEAKKTWSFDMDALPSETSKDGVILRIGELQRG